MNKKLTGIFAMCALLLTGCQGAKESSKEITPPDTGWGKTVDEVLADWNLDRDQVEIFSETSESSLASRPAVRCISSEGRNIARMLSSWMNEASNE